MAEVRLQGIDRAVAVGGEEMSLTLEIQFSYDTRRAGNTDDPADTIDSGQLIDCLERSSEAGHWNTLEGYAASSMNTLLQEFPRIDGLRISIERPLEISGVSQTYSIKYGRYE